MTNLIILSNFLIANFTFQFPHYTKLKMGFKILEGDRLISAAFERAVKILDFLAERLKRKEMLLEIRERKAQLALLTLENSFTDDVPVDRHLSDQTLLLFAVRTLF